MGSNIYIYIVKTFDLLLKQIGTLFETYKFLGNVRNSIRDSIANLLRITFC